MSDTPTNICIINAESGVGTASPQITQFSSDCDCIKFIVKRDLSTCAVVVITSIDGSVNMVTEGDSLIKTYDAKAKETTIEWYPQTAVTCMSGCVVYQIAAYDTVDDSKFIWYSKEGRLIVTDSIDTTDYSTALIASSPNLITQLITQMKSMDLSLESKVDKIDGKGLSSNDYTDVEKESLKALLADNQANMEKIDSNALKIKDLGNEFSEYSSSVHIGEKEYNPQSELSQSGKAVAQAIAGILNSAPETLDTLEELAKALGNDPNFATTIMELLGKKVDKADGKGLSTNDYTDDEKSKLERLYNYDDTLVKERISDIESDVSSLESNKVDKVTGKGLSSNDFTDEEKEKLGSLAEVATTGSYNDLSDKPMIDLGIFDETTYDQYHQAIHMARQTGIYKCTYKDGSSVENALIFVNACNDPHGNELVTQMRLWEDPVESYDMDHLEYIWLPEFRKYYHDGEKYVWTAWQTIEEDTRRKTSSASDFDVEDEEHYPSVAGVVNHINYNLNVRTWKCPNVYVNGGFIFDYNPEPQAVRLKVVDPLPEGEVCDFVLYNREFGGEKIIETQLTSNFTKSISIPRINIDGQLMYSTSHKVAFEYRTLTDKSELATTDYVVEAIRENLLPVPIRRIPSTLVSNKQYNFGEIQDLSLAFPTSANDGDVIYLTFKSGVTPTALTIDTTNTCDIEVIPEANTGYEIFGKYNGSIWIVNYYEYTVSEE